MCVLLMSFPCGVCACVSCSRPLAPPPPMPRRRVSLPPTSPEGCPVAPTQLLPVALDLYRLHPNEVATRAWETVQQVAKEKRRSAPLSGRREPPGCTSTLPISPTPTTTARGERRRAVGEAFRLSLPRRPQGEWGDACSVFPLEIFFWLHLAH